MPAEYGGGSGNPVRFSPQYRADVKRAGQSLKRSRSQGAPRRSQPVRGIANRRGLGVQPGPAIAPSPTGRYVAQGPPPDPMAGLNDPNQIESWLGNDTTYKTQLIGFDRTLSGFLADEGSRRSTANTDLETGRKQLGESRVKDFSTLEDDYASRGLLRSGLYQKAFDDLGRDYTNRGNQLQTTYDQLLAELAGAQTKFRSDREISMQQAKQDALNRRAQEMMMRLGGG